MKPMTSAAIRESFLEFFAQRGHTRVPSSSLVPGNDPTLLFANSGMVPFKDTFLGLEQRPYRRAVTAQKCLRVSGKHNDLEEVGRSPRHHTFFEMLGNFSFGDYFKADAIPMAWTLLTDVFALPVERLWFTVFQGNERVAADEDAAARWVAAGADPQRVLRFGEKDNFWVMADTGPCGPCSEITMYIGDDLQAMHAGGVNSDDPDYVEIWNNVFMQFERSTMQPLPRPSVDTGMGLERMAMVLQGVRSTYETDLFVPIIERTIGLLGSDPAHYQAHRAAYRAIADHSRAVAFLIADGVLPGNTGRSYVLRRILRRAVYQGRSIGFEQPFFADVVATVIDRMSPVYPDLERRRQFILDAADAEEQQFRSTLSGGVVRLNAVIAQARQQARAHIAGDDAFMLKDTYGFPLDLTQRIAADAGMQVDEAGYEAAMAAQRQRSRAATRFKRGGDLDAWSDHDLPATRFVGYEALHASARVLALVVNGDRVSEAVAGQSVQIVLDVTPFYAESGGQIGDAGVLSAETGQVAVHDAQRPLPGVIVHDAEVRSGVLRIGASVDAAVTMQTRRATMRNHTATHLMHRALRDVLGEHAAQAGSLVSPERLRFDFTHHRPVTAEQLRDIEQRVNDWIRDDEPVSWRELPYQAALDAGALALFGEKYGDRVRMVTVGDAAAARSRELCGGTHVARTGEIGAFRITAESSVAAGVRRIEALTGSGADAFDQYQSDTLRELAVRLGVAPGALVDRVEALAAELRQQQRTIDALHARLAAGTVETLLEAVREHAGVRYIAAHAGAADATRLRELGDRLRDRLGSGVIVLASAHDERAQVLVMVTRDLTAQGVHAGQLVRTLAAIVGGSGGGRPEMAQAGGREPGRIAEALAGVPDAIASQRR